MKELGTSYMHRGVIILRVTDGWKVERMPFVFKALTDAEGYINNVLDGNDRTVPRIVRMEG